MKTNTKVNVGNESQTGETNDSAGAWIVVGQSDGEKKHMKRGEEKVGPLIASPSRGQAMGVFYMHENRAVLCT